MEEERPIVDMLRPHTCCVFEEYPRVRSVCEEFSYSRQFLLVCSTATTLKGPFCTSTTRLRRSVIARRVVNNGVLENPERLFNFRSPTLDLRRRCGWRSIRTIHWSVLRMPTTGTKRLWN